MRKRSPIKVRPCAPQTCMDLLCCSPLAGAGTSCIALHKLTTRGAIRAEVVAVRTVKWYLHFNAVSVRDGYIFLHSNTHLHLFLCKLLAGISCPLSFGIPTPGFAGCALEASSHWRHLSSLPLDITSKYFLGVYQLGFPSAWGTCSPFPLKQLHWPIFLPCFWIPDHDSACQRSVKFPKLSSGSRGGHLPVWGHWTIRWYKMIDVD